MVSRLEVLEKRNKQREKYEKEVVNIENTEIKKSSKNKKVYSFQNPDGSFKDEYEELEINEDFKYTFDRILNHQKNLLISGSGGVGKSTFLHLLDKFLKEIYKGKSYNYVYTAPTGIASVNIKGST